MSALDLLNRSQRAVFGRKLYNRIALPRTVATRVLMEQISMARSARLGCHAADHVSHS